KRVRRNARARVRDADRRRTVRGRHHGGDASLAAESERIERVLEQVHEHLAELLAVAAHDHTGGNGGVEPDAERRETGGEGAERRFQEGTQVEGLEAVLLAP